MRLTVVGSWFDIDYFNILEGKDAADTEPIGPVAIQNSVAFKAQQYETYRVFSLNGAMVGTISLNGAKAGEALRAAGYDRGVYMLRSVNGNKRFMTKVAE